MKIVRRTVRQKQRVIVHNQGKRNVRQAIGLIYPGMEIYGVSSGQYHFINILEHVVGQIKEPLTLTVSSWTIAKFEASKLGLLGKLNHVEHLRVIVDTSMLKLVPASFSALRDLIADDSIRFLRCHCKFAVIVSRSWNIVIRTSMNLNQNKRLENFEISDCDVLADYMNDIVDDIFSTAFNSKDAVRIDVLGRNKIVENNDLTINISDFDIF